MLMTVGKAEGEFCSRCVIGIHAKSQGLKPTALAKENMDHKTQYLEMLPGWASKLKCCQQCKCSEQKSFHSTA